LHQAHNDLNLEIEDMSSDQLSIAEKLKQWRAENATAPKAISASINSVGLKAPLPTAPLCRSTRNSLPSSQAVRTIEGSYFHSSF
jgi:hypothetical protein